jgi:SAM-dependent methyltransferase
MSATGYAVDDKFWRGFGLAGALPDVFQGKSVLEIGCGGGNRTFEAAAHGASRVVGLDPAESLITMARAAQGKLSAPWARNVAFVLGKIEAVGDEAFDVIISEDTLEHVMDVRGLLEQLHRHLRPRGRVYIGFGPLYHAPDGDHGWLRAVLPGRRWFPWPWGHLFLRGYAFRKLSRQHGQPIVATHDWPYLDLHQHTIDEYRHLFVKSGFRIASLRTNAVYSLKGRLVRALARLPGLERYLTLNIFVVLERPA